MAATLAKVFDAWERSAHLHLAEPPTAVDAAERALGRALPDDARELYGAVGGGSFLEGNLGLHPPGPPEEGEEQLTLATASALLRSWDWPVPDELVVFGDNGAGDHFGVWLPAGGGARPVVVQIGEVFEPACLAVVGDDLASFLAGWTAYYLASLGAPVDALDALGVPDELRSLDEDGSDEEHFALLSWASPGLPDPCPDPYERGLTAPEVDAIARDY